MEAPEGLVVEAAGRDDLEPVVRTHARSLPDDVFPALGDAFLARYYARALDGAGQRLLVARDRDAHAGFCLLSWAEDATRSLLGPGVAVAAARLLVRRPRLLLAGVLQLARRPTPVPGSAEIAFIAVEPSHQGRGVGAALVERAMAVASGEGRGTLTTKTANERLAAFYAGRFGAEVVEDYTILGTRYRVLAWPTG